MFEPREPRSIIEAAEHAAAAGNYVAAEELLRDAALLQEASLGPLHPELANTLNNLGVVCEITDKPVDAEHYFRRACTIARTALDRDHPFVTTSEKNLRDFCEARGKPVELPTQAPEVTATLEAQATSSVDSPGESQVHVEPHEVEPLVARRSFSRLAIGALGPVAMLMVILAAGLPRLSSTAQPESSSAIAIDLAQDIHPPDALPKETTTPHPPDALPKETTTAEVHGGDTDGTNARRTTAAPTAARATLVRARLCAELEEWHCDPPDRPVPPGPLFFYTQVKSTSATTVQHRWYQGNRLDRSVTLRVQASPSVGHRTYSRNILNSGSERSWRVELWTDDGVLLHEERFSVQRPPQR